MIVNYGIMNSDTFFIKIIVNYWNMNSYCDTFFAQYIYIFHISKAPFTCADLLTVCKLYMYV